MVTGKALPDQLRAAIERSLKVSCVVGFPSHDAAKQHGIEEWPRIRESVVWLTRNRSRESVVDSPESQRERLPLRGQRRTELHIVSRDRERPIE